MAEPPELASVVDHLYGLTPDRFTAARTAAEKDARAAGDRALAAAVKRLRRPAQASWAVNLLVRRERGLVEEVTQLGASLREAQAQLHGDALRQLIRQRRHLVAAVSARARQLAEDEGHPLGQGAVQQVEETLQAAMADPAAAAAVLAGTLTQPLSSTGLESLAPPQPRAAPGERRPHLTVVPEDDEAQREEARARLEAARKAVRKATKSRDSAVKKRAKAQAKVLQIEAEMEELQRRLAALEADSEGAADTLTDREAAVEETEAVLADTLAEEEAAQQALDRL